MAVFSDLPLEIREAIWKYTLADTPEVWILQPEPEDSEAAQAMISEGEGGAYVLTGFPKAMHVCFESRAVALKHTAALAKMSLEDGSSLAMPCRPFRPDLDYLYSPVAMHCLTRRAPVYERVRHLAFPADNLMRGWKAVYRYLRRFPALEDISVVFGPHYGQRIRLGDGGDGGGDDVSLGDGRRSGRYKLVRCPEAGLRIQVDADTSAPVKKTIAGMRKDLEVLARLVYDEQAVNSGAPPRKPIAVRTVKMVRRGKTLVYERVEEHVLAEGIPGGYGADSSATTGRSGAVLNS